MKTVTVTGLSACVAVAVASAVLLAGCENNSEVENQQSEETPEFMISPSNVAIGGGTNVVILTVVGGRPPFTWQVSDTALGTLSATGATVRVVNYHVVPSAGTGANTVQVRDVRGWTASSIIIH